MSLSRLLPAPVHEKKSTPSLVSEPRVSTALISRLTAPPYGAREQWVPRKPDDYGDGGAYPECHVAQYPLGMGQVASTSNALQVQLDAEGNIKYDALIRQGKGKDVVVFSKFSDLLPKSLDDEEGLEKPTEEDVQESTEKTRQALEQLVGSKMAASMPVKVAEKAAPAQYVRYTPSQQAVAFNSGAKQRIIRMVETQKDPLSPPRFKINKKLPRGPPSPPAPVMHSPPRKVTQKEQADWKIPPCISNWKNARGYTIPLDKRLAADGRGQQQPGINENFSKVANALEIASRMAREGVEARAQVEKRMAQKVKEKKEQELRLLAQKARDERAGIRAVAAAVGDEDDEAKTRDQLRKEREKERQRERNIARAAPEKRNALERDRDRDISEMIALGVPNPGQQKSFESEFDARLFNGTRGMDAGFGDEDGYHVYDKAWRDEKEFSTNIYRPAKGNDGDVYGEELEKLVSAGTTSRFMPEKGFSGASGSGDTRNREGPVQFEKQDNDDPFGLNKFLQEAKTGGTEIKQSSGDKRDRDRGDDRGSRGAPSSHSRDESRSSKKSRRD